MANPSTSGNPAIVGSQVSTIQTAGISVNQPSRPQVSGSLYIGDLDPEIGESALYDLFKDIGAVASIRVCRDAISRVSLGYAYVNFNNVENAERAISVLNGAMLNKRPCRIMWSRRDPSIRRTNIGNIFIKNLDPEIDLGSLYDLFSTFGNIHSCKLVTWPDGKSKGYGFVHYHTPESAEDAIQKMSNKKLNGKVVYVAPFIPSKDRPKKNPEETYTNVYIKNIAENVTQDMLKEHFSKFGEITSCLLVENKESKKPSGFGFANYKTHDEAVSAVKGAHGTEFHGKVLYAARAQPKAERKEHLKRDQDKFQGINLYIKNIDDGVTEDKLDKLFSEFGTITSIKIMQTEKGVSKGFGFVCFSNQNEATKALTKMNNYLLEGKPLYVAIAERKEQRKQKLEQQHAQNYQRSIHHTPLMSNFAPTGVYYPPGQRIPNQRPFPFPTPGRPGSYPPQNFVPSSYRGNSNVSQARNPRPPSRGQSHQMTQQGRVPNFTEKSEISEIQQKLLDLGHWSLPLVQQIAPVLMNQVDVTELLNDKNKLLESASKVAEGLTDQ